MRRIASILIFLGAAAFAAGLPAISEFVQPVPALLQKVETQRGQPLTVEQRQQFSRTAASLRDALLPAQQKFVRTIAGTFSLPEAEVQAMLPAIGSDSIGFDMSIIPRIEARRGRSVTPQELQQIRQADNAKKAEMGEVQARYTRELARIAGVSRDQIQRMLPAAGI
jgi:hypothetical protein